MHNRMRHVAATPEANAGIPAALCGTMDVFAPIRSPAVLNQRRNSVPLPKMTRSRRTLLAELGACAALAPLAGLSPSPARAQSGVTTPDGRVYTAYTPAAEKVGQFYQYTCEFDASWVILKTFGHDVPFEEQLAIVGHDTSVEPWYQETAEGFIIYGGDITQAFSGDYTSNMLARSTGSAFVPLFEHFGLEARPVATREEIEDVLDKGGLVWMKATVDFLPWANVTWVTPDGKELPGVLGNDHAVVVIGYNDAGPVIRDVLGPTNTNWERPTEYDVPWETFLPVFEAQGADGVGVLQSESGAGPARIIQPGYSGKPANEIQPGGPKPVCC